MSRDKFVSVDIHSPGVIHLRPWPTPALRHARACGLGSVPPAMAPTRTPGPIGLYLPRNSPYRIYGAWTFIRVCGLLVLMACMDSAGAEFKGSVTFQTDQVYRGYSKSRGRPALSANLEYGHESGVYTGVWVSQVSFDSKNDPDRANVEINPYLGWTYRLAQDWRTDLSASRYLYDGKLFGWNSDYNEFYGALHFRDLLTARIAFADNAYQRKATTFAYEISGRYSPLDDWQISAGLGFHQAAELLHADYFYWNAGLTWYPTRFMALDLRYVDAKLGRYRLPGSHPDYGEFHPKPLDRQLLFSLSLGF